MDPSINQPPIYLDQAATGWPKHPAVIEAVTTQMQTLGAAAGRGSYRRGNISTQVLQNVRAAASELFHSAGQGQWILTHNGTSALNQAILGTLHPGAHVITTQIEHNSVLRPLYHLASLGQITLEIVPCDPQGHLPLQNLLSHIRPETRLLAISHGSNVTGALFPLAEFSDLIRNCDYPALRILLDAAQTAGVVPIDLRETPVDFLAMPGHKGLGGPLGTGLLYCGPKTVASITPILWGGTGNQSDQLDMPTMLPERLEAGNINVPAFAGLLEGIKQTLTRDLAAEAQANRLRTMACCAELRDIAGIELFAAEQLAIISLRLRGYAVQELAMILDSEFGIEARAGLHCAPLIHKALGTFPEGTLRISFSTATPDDSLATAIAAMREIADAT